jgi:hypothetical protein
MSFSPPTVFADGTVLTAAALEGDYEALRVYLHRGIIAGDLKTSAPWIDTKHIQPPERNPFSGVQHGVSGHQGGQWAGGVDVRLAFATKFLSGNGRPGNDAVHGLQQTSFSLAIRRAAKILYHYWFEVENGKDESTAAYQTSEAYRFAYIIPWVGNISTALSGYSFAAQEVGATDFGLQSTYPRGLQQPLAIHGGYGSRQGTLAYDYNAVGTATFGLAVHGLSDRCGVVNWGVSIEAFYL